MLSFGENITAFNFQPCRNPPFQTSVKYRHSSNLRIGYFAPRRKMVENLLKLLEFRKTKNPTFRCYYAEKSGFV